MFKFSVDRLAWPKAVNRFLKIVQLMCNCNKQKCLFAVKKANQTVIKKCRIHKRGELQAGRAELDTWGLRGGASPTGWDAGCHLSCPPEHRKTCPEQLFVERNDRMILHFFLETKPGFEPRLLGILFAGRHPLFISHCKQLHHSKTSLRSLFY